MGRTRASRLEARRVSRRRSWIPSPGRTGMTSRLPTPSRFVRLARPWSTELLEQELLQMDSRAECPRCPWLTCRRKVMKRPRFDLTKLMDLHGEGSGTTTVTTDSATGEVVERPEGYEPPTQESV